MGELGTDDFDKNPNVWTLWIVFFLSTVLLQITMLNLLIAIMGDTFDRVLDAQEEAQMKQVCEFI